MAVAPVYLTAVRMSGRCPRSRRAVDSEQVDRQSELLGDQLGAEGRRTGQGGRTSCRDRRVPVIAGAKHGVAGGGVDESIRPFNGPSPAECRSC